MNELTVSKNNKAFENQLAESFTKSQEIANTLAALSTLSTKNIKTLNFMLTEQQNLQRYQIGYNLGLIKAYIDTLPPAIAANQKLNGIQLDMLIKLKIDSAVLDQREGLHTSDFTIEREYWPRYRRLSELICGYGYSMTFSQERYQEFYPAGIHMTVTGFANGYSKGFHTIAAEAGIETATTHPVEQDIWKNWPFFMKHDVLEYHLDGKYLFMYHSGFNCSGNPDIPHRLESKTKTVNDGVYEKLQARPESEFITHEFNIEF